MTGPHETANVTPVPSPRAQPSRAALVSTPPRQRGALTLGSSAGYGIVSAAGLNAWRRQPKRNANGSAMSVGSKKRKMGLGMGHEGTPGRRATKRTRRTSKVCLCLPFICVDLSESTLTDQAAMQASIGAQSTPKARTSYSRPGDPSSTPSTMLDLDSSLTEPDSQQEDRDAEFAVGATTIATVGQDVFGLTIAIDPDGTTREISPEAIRAHPSSSYATTSGPGSTASEDDTRNPGARAAGFRLGRVYVRPGERPRSGWSFDNWDEDAYEHWRIRDQEDAELDTLMVPVNFGDSSSVDIPEDLAIAEEKEERFVADISSASVPQAPETHPTSFSPNLYIDDFTYDDDFMTMIDQTVVVPLNDHLDSSSGPLGDGNDSSSLRKRQSREKIASRQKTPKPREPHVLGPLVSYNSNSPPSTPAASPETGRGLKLSVLSRAADFAISIERPGSFSEPDHDSPSSSPLSSLPDENFGDPGHSSISIGGRIEDVEPANRLSALPQHAVPAFNDPVSLGVRPGWHEHPGLLQDPFGLIKVEQLAKGHKPARYRASSELASSPPRPATRTRPRVSESADQSTPPTSPSVMSPPDTRQGQGPSETRKNERDQYVTRHQEDTDSWRGLWKGGQRQRTVKKAKPSVPGPEDVKDKTIVHFIEPHYPRAAREARDARIAHYKDLAENYTLYIKGVQF